MSLHGRRLLYDPAHQHDACGVGFVADVSGRYNPGLAEIRRLDHWTHYRHPQTTST